MTAPRACLLFLVAAGLSASACTSYEYEEDVFLEVDGSGRLRVSGSEALLDALLDAEVTPTSLASSFDGEGLAVGSVRETKRDGRSFFHVQGRFRDWNELCRHPAFRGRRCRLARVEDALELEVEIPPFPGAVPPGVDPGALVGFRFHLPSTIRAHNAPGGVRRGNILAWERSVAETFGDAPLVVQARFDRESVLRTTLRVLALALGTVVVAVAAAVGLMVRRGRRQLAAEARAASATTTR